MLCEQLSDAAAFPTLYNCVTSSKHFSNAGAVNALYRICHESPVKGGGSEGLSLAEQGQNVSKWAILWRSITLSALGSTMYPYCRHLRTLDFRDLGYLLEDDKFRGKVMKAFFEGEMTRFHFTHTVGKGRAVRLDTSKIIRAIGDEIIQQAPLLDGLSGPATSDVLSNALTQWAPRLNNLRRLELWDGKVFADETTRNLLHVHCPNLQSLSMYLNSAAESDHAMSSFIGGMQENKLTYFENIGNCGIGAETCLALNRHGKSLSTLKLFLSEEGVLALGTLRGCTALRELAVASERASVDLKATQNDNYLEIVEWLKDCAELKKVAFHNFPSAPDLLTPILQNKHVRLESLDVSAVKEDAMYVVKDHREFHQAITQQQRSLRALHLIADADPVTRDDIETLMNALCSLTAMQELKLVRISDYLNEEHIKLLARYMTDLRELYIGGYGISDGVLGDVAKLRELKTISFSGITAFTYKGVREFVDQLSEGNKGLVIAVDNADPDFAISPEEQELLREHIQTKLDGRFEYQLLRGKNLPNVS